ncbi:hypothetical protein DOTSEDRAFT_75363 [Dothistroma septosporum NZE10]|uniref:Uncharacterized protein n=1 Tax=Dothistroma septosporum (strain NZE10 / CBS 128990) TaxID=675120 RepID=M2YL51_DOTSN|nr:hypothetical protein DOTSEDRAFT_75363 [Dothistroma septosporum NZE10]
MLHSCLVDFATLEAFEWTCVFGSPLPLAVVLLQPLSAFNRRVTALAGDALALGTLCCCFIILSGAKKVTAVQLSKPLSRAVEAVGYTTVSSGLIMFFCHHMLTYLLALDIPPPSPNRRYWT